MKNYKIDTPLTVEEFEKFDRLDREMLHIEIDHVTMLPYQTLEDGSRHYLDIVGWPKYEESYGIKGVIDKIKMPSHKVDQHISVWEDLGYDITIVDINGGQLKELSAIKTRITDFDYPDDPVEFKELIEIDDTPLADLVDNLSKTNFHECEDYVSPFATFNDTCPSTVIGKFVDSSNNYVVPTFAAQNYYDDDYILNTMNYGIIFGNTIHWYEIGTSTPILHTEKNENIYEIASEKHALLIRSLNHCAVDLLTLSKWRDDKKNVSKKAIQDEKDAHNKENDQLVVWMDEFIKLMTLITPDKKLVAQLIEIYSNVHDELPVDFCHYAMFSAVQYIKDKSVKSKVCQLLKDYMDDVGGE